LEILLIAEDDPALTARAGGNPEKVSRAGLLGIPVIAAAEAEYLGAAGPAKTVLEATALIPAFDAHEREASDPPEGHRREVAAVETVDREFRVAVRERGCACGERSRGR
jgi:hypothetical protein